jgi:hypothetical protein
MLHAPPFDLITRITTTTTTTIIIITTIDHKAPCSVVFSTLLSPCSFKVQISSLAYYSWTPSAYIHPSMWATKFLTHTKQNTKLQFCVDSKLEDYIMIITIFQIKRQGKWMNYPLIFNLGKSLNMHLSRNFTYFLIWQDMIKTIKPSL